MMLSCLNNTTGSVYNYNVTPDDHYYPNTTCHHCHKLQHYLLNTTKYFTSNTQLLFLPGLHHLHTDLIIQNVHSISLIGSTTNGTTLDTVIQCNLSVGIVMINITNLIVTNMTVRSCLGNEYNNATVLIKQCTNVQLRHVVIEESHNSYGIVGINILGDSCFSYITNNAIIIIYNDTTVDMETHSLTIDHYYNNVNGNNVFKCKIILHLLQQTYNINFHLLKSIFQGLMYAKAMNIKIKNKGVKQNIILVRDCKFFNNSGNLINIEGGHTEQGEFTNIVHFDNCIFLNNIIGQNKNHAIIYIMYEWLNIQIINCIFKYNNFKVLYLSASLGDVQISIANTTFVSNTLCEKDYFILINSVDIHLIGPILFQNITNAKSVFFLQRSKMTCYNYVKFAQVEADYILWYWTYKNFYLFIKDKSDINITHSKFEQFSMVQISPLIITKEYPPCFFQYVSNKTLDDTYISMQYSIIFKNNQVTSSEQYAYDNLPITHCSWLPQSAFSTAMPLEVNEKFIKYINIQSDKMYSLPQRVRKKTMCYCTASANTSYDCYKDIVASIYPGQTLTLNLYMDVNNIIGFESSNTIITVVNDVDWLPPTACLVNNYSVQFAKSNACNTLEYTITFPTDNWCELFLKGYSDGSNTEKIDIYYINQKSCPVGFTKIDGTCQCDLFLKKYNIICDITDQALIRPSKAWILPILHDKLYNYQISVECPFHYCLPHSSHLNFSTPNSQCQFNRSGILCGHCQQGLSTVFGSSHCQQCSNIYLFLIVLVAIAGLVLVLLLFILNLTVTDGTISAFILYVNIISINMPVFFSQTGKFTSAYTFISLANLDLGVQTCFYNGMDDYAKMWLQLAFPFYLIFIATSLIITSRYSTTIQRLTARRALPVLATLFLLSYTKILLIISSVLFSYSTIIHLPSEHTIMVWSLDANITLLGIRFVILFLTCLILFLILIPFNIILLFTKTLSRFQFITKFKPLLDAYQGPYKIKFYYWTGLQLLIRVVFFGMSSLNRDINLIIGIILLIIFGGIHGTIQPFKTAVKNYQELVLILNLQVMYTISLYGRESVTSIILNVMITMAAVHFMFIVLYYIITYIHGGIVRKKMEMVIYLLAKQIKSLHNKSQVEQYHLEVTTRNKIPEVAYRYYEYQEPLVGQIY